MCTKAAAAIEQIGRMFSGGGGEKHLRGAHWDASVRPDAQCLHRCMDDSQCPDKNRPPGDASPAGEHCPGPRIGRQSHSSSFHALHSLFPKTSTTSSLNPTSRLKEKRCFLFFSFFPPPSELQAEFRTAAAGSFGRIRGDAAGFFLWRVWGGKRDPTGCTSKRREREAGSRRISAARTLARGAKKRRKGPDLKGVRVR